MTTSVTGTLTGKGEMLTGTTDVKGSAGQHFYDFDYTLRGLTGA